MDARTRRQGIAKYLEQAHKPVSATTLAKEFSVSRQVIVGDVALLRAGGLDITATPRGYLLPSPTTRLRRTLACHHAAEQIQAEMNAIVDHGCTVVDVIVEHPIYGQISGALQLSTRYEVEQFVHQLQTTPSAAPLIDLTSGSHLHTILCPDEAAFERVKQSLRQMGFLTDA